MTAGGYVLYATKPSFPDGVADGTATVRELMAVDDDARVRLWQYLLGLDLMARVKARVAADDLCPWNTGAWRLSGGPDGATCARTQERADLTLTVGDLGAAYLGGTPLRLGNGRAGAVGRGHPVEDTRGALAAVGAIGSGPFSPLTW